MPTAPDDTLLIFRIDRIPCAVPATSVQSIVMPPERLTHPPGSDQARPGIFRHAEHVYAVVDLHQRFGIDTPRSGAGRFLLHGNETQHHALWVDEVVGLVRSEEGTWAALPGYLPRSLFQRGFLYQQEIVLCTHVDALLAMHDAEPIRRHLESLQRQAESESAPSEVSTPTVERDIDIEATEAPPSTPHRAPTQTITPREKNASTPPSTNETSVARRPPPSGSTRQQRQKAAPQIKPQVATPKTEKKLIKPPTSISKVTPAVTTASHPSQTGQASIKTSVSDKTSPPSSRPIDDAPRRWSLWLLLITLLGTAVATGLYLLMDKEEKGSDPYTRSHLDKMRSDYQPSRSDTAPATPSPTLPPVETATPTTSVTSPTVPLPLQEKPVASLKITLPPLETTTPDSVEPEPVTSALAKDLPAIQITRDEEGVISLIIERDKLPPLPVPTSSEAHTEATPDESPVTDSKQAAGGSEHSEPPLQPDADWPIPSRLIEPCDCIHTVVRGDTLWAIAKRYTRNAFNYPALARQSGIRNPHRIYPGNQVRIIIR